MRQQIILGVFTGFCLMAAWWFYGHSFIDITVSQAAGRPPYSYTILDKSGGLVFKKQSGSPHIRKLVGRGTYQVLVETSAGSEYRIIQTGGLLRKTAFEARLIPEKSRVFVGNNPGFCMHYGQAVLYSYSCSDTGGITVHLPASQEAPTTTQTAGGGTASYAVRGLIDVGGAPKALLTYVEDETGQGVVALYDLNPQLTLTASVKLPGIAYDNVQHIAQKGSGFFVYNDTFSKVYEYASPSTLSGSFGFRPSLPTVANPVELSSYGDSYGALFNSGTGEDRAAESSQKTRKSLSGSSEFMVRGSSVKAYRFSKLYTGGVLCGDSKLCLTSGGVLDVYSISGKKPRLIFSLPDVQKVFTDRGQMIMVTNKRVLSINQSTLIGSAQYNFGKSRGYCGAGPAAPGYVLCVVNNKGGTSALYINTTLSNQDSIDQKVFSLLEDPNVSDVSAYQNFIYISPNLGKLTYNNELGGYDYDPGIKRSTTRNINQLIKRIGIDTSRYTIINPYAAY